MNTFADKVKRIQETLRQASMDFTFEGSAAAEDQLRMASEAFLIGIATPNPRQPSPRNQSPLARNQAGLWQ